MILNKLGTFFLKGIISRRKQLKHHSNRQFQSKISKWLGDLALKRVAWIYTMVHQILPAICYLLRPAAMGLPPDTQNCGMRMRRERGNVFPTTTG